jgi:hypothetical protein
MEDIIFWDLLPRSSAEAGGMLQASCLAYYSTLKMEAVSLLKMLGNYRTTRRYIPED